MDLSLYGRVLWRFKWIAAVGFALAIVLAVLATAKVTFHGWVPSLKYRHPVQYKALALLFVTQTGFPDGRSTLGDLMRAPGQTGTTTGGSQTGATTGGSQTSTTTGSSSSTTYLPRFADPNRFTELALDYSNWATGDPIRKVMRSQGGRVTGLILANPLVAASGNIEPFIQLAGVAPSKAGALHLTNRVIQALQTYLKQQQNANHVPQEERTVILPVNNPGDVTVYQGHSKTKPLFVLLAVLLATIGVCFILENVRPRVRVAPEPEALAVPPTRVRAAGADGATTVEPPSATASAADGRSSSA
jgi:hypothetical protein